MARMNEANPRLSDEVARHLTLHGTNWNSDGSLIWKFDNYVRAFSPYGQHVPDAVELFGQIVSPTLIFWGLESFFALPHPDPRLKAIPNSRLVPFPNPCHWTPHYHLDLFLKQPTP